jgi:hypothetical protein
MKTSSIKSFIAITVLTFIGLLLASPVIAEEANEAVASESFSVFKNVNNKDVQPMDDSQMNEVIGAAGGWPTLSFTRDAGRTAILIFQLQPCLTVQCGTVVRIRGKLVTPTIHKPVPTPVISVDLDAGN